MIHKLKVRDLKSRREGKSRIFLSSELIDFDLDRIFFLANTVQIHDERYIVYRKDNLDYMLFAPRLVTRNDTVFALGNGDKDPLRSFFITRSHEMVNQGESYLDALELPTLAVTSKNEGESESKVWVVGQLNVKGEGESVMYYLGFPVVNKELKGSSRLIHLP